MASPLSRAHIEAQARLRRIVVGAVGAIWADLPGYDRENVDEWISRVVPVVLTAQRASAALTDAYIAQIVGRPPLGIPQDQVIGAGVRNGTAPAEVYERPFVTLWSKLGAGVDFPAASAAALARATGTAAMDVQLAMRATADAVEREDDNIFGFERVADPGACNFCQEVDGAYVKRADAMALHNNCVIGDSAVWIPAGCGTEPAGLRTAHAATRRWYQGEVVILGTAAGYELTVTPNHPVLTDRGWVAAGLLREGDSVVSSTRFDGVGGCVPDEQQMPARIEDRFRAGAVATLALVPLTAQQLHGDGPDGEVDVVPLHGGLDARDLAALFQPAKQLALPLGLGRSLSRAGRCRSCEGRILRRSPALRGVRRRGTRLAFSGAFSRCRNPVLLAAGSQYDSAANEVSAHSIPSHSIPLRKREHGLPAEVQLDSIREARRISWSGHVYNLVTSCGWYMANAIVTHNCGCGLDPLTEPHRLAASLPSGVAVHQHGELGPMLGAPGHDFTSEADL